MAESVASGVLTELTVEAVKALTKMMIGRAEEIKLGFGYKDQLEKLKRKFQYVEAFLHDLGNSTEKQRSRLVDTWLNKVKDVAYMTQDVMDEYEYEMLHRKLQLKHRRPGGTLSKRLPKCCFPMPSNMFFNFRMSHKLSAILLQFDELDEEARKIGLNQVKIATHAVARSSISINETAAAWYQDRLHACAGGAEFVGRKEDEAKLLEMFCHPHNDNRALSTVAIVGMGGLGKTTLARRLYEHPDIGMQFGSNKMWISVAQDFKIIGILNQMIESLTSSKADLSNTEGIERKLEESLKDKRFLLVLDDVWAEDQVLWDSLRASLERIRGLPESVIIVTTRSNEVARVAGAVYKHMLKKLSHEESWDLFSKRAYMINPSSQVSDLKDVGRRIVEKCKGVPLALKVMGSLLQSKQHPLEWKTIEESELWNLPQGRDQILPSLLLSFNSLSSPLKQSFAICAIFPKAWRLQKCELIGLWSAQGLLHTSNVSDSSLEICEDYIRILVNNSLFEEGVIKRNGLKYYRMHDLVHDLAIYASGNDMLIDVSRHEFSSVLSAEKKDWMPRAMNIMGGIPRIVLRQGSHLHTLMLTSCGLTEVPHFIELVKHLRYVDLSQNPIKTLPDSIGKLHQLHSLGLRECELMTRLPKVLEKLVSLSHITTTTPMFASRGLLQLPNLQTIPQLRLDDDPEGWTIDQLDSLHELRGKLHIEGLEHVRNNQVAQKSFFSRKDKITELTLVWSTERDPNEVILDEDVLDGLQPHPNIMLLDIYNFFGVKFPTWISSMAVYSEEHRGHVTLLSNLTVVKLLNCKNCITLPTLGQLLLLKCLILSGFDVECIGNEFYGSNELGMPCVVPFQSLTELEISDFMRLTTWKLPTSATPFPCLESLRVRACCSLETIPALDIKSLRILELFCLKQVKSVDILTYSTGLMSLNMTGLPEIESLPQELSKYTMLQELKLSDLYKLISLPCGQGSLISLQSLTVKCCDAMTSLPDDLLDGLSSLRAFNVTDCRKLTRIPSSLKGCTSLEELIISTCPLVEVSPVAFSELRKLLRLTIMFNSGENLRYVVEGLVNLPRLNTLAIQGYEDEEEMREYFSDMGPFLRLPFLTALYLYGKPNIKSLPPQLGLLTRIVHLVIWKFPDLEEIADWIENLSSLEILYLEGCGKLRRLPSKQVLQRLPHLGCLAINGCPELVERYVNKDSPEWDSIQHISYIKVDDEVIQDVPK